MMYVLNYRVCVLINCGDGTYVKCNRSVISLYLQCMSSCILYLLFRCWVDTGSNS